MRKLNLDPSSPADMAHAANKLLASYGHNKPDVISDTWERVLERLIHDGVPLSIVEDVLVAIGEEMGRANYEFRRRDERRAEMALLQNAEEL